MMCDDNIEYFDHTLVFNSSSDATCHICSLKNDEIYFRCEGCEKCIHTECIGYWDEFYCLSLEKNVIKEENEGKICQSASTPSSLASTSTPIVSSHSAYTLPTENTNKKKKFSTGNINIFAKLKEKRASKNPFSEANSDRIIHTLSSFELPEKQKKKSRLASSQSFSGITHSGENESKSKSLQINPNYDDIVELSRISKKTISSQSNIMKVNVENGMIDSIRFEQLAFLSKTELNYLRSELKNGRKKKGVLEKEKNKLMEETKKIVEMLENSLKIRNKSSSELSTCVSDFLDAVNRNTISLRSTLRKIEMMYMCLVRQESVKSPFICEVEMPERMWIDTDDPETVEHIGALRTVIRRCESFLHLKETLRSEKEILENDLHSIHTFNNHLDTLLTHTKGAHQHSLSGIEQGKKAIKTMKETIEKINEWRGSVDLPVLNTLPLSDQSHLLISSSISSLPSSSPVSFKESWNEGKEERAQIRYTEGGNEVTHVTVNKMIELVTSEAVEESFLKSFLLIYPAFISPIELLEKIIFRYCIAPEIEGEIVEEKDKEKDKEIEKENDDVEIKQTQQIPTRMRVIHLLKRWIDSLSPSDLSSPRLRSILSNFARYSLSPTAFPFFSSYLLSICESKNRVKSDEISDEISFPTPPPPLDLPSSLPFTLSSLSSLEIARQITLMNEQVYHRIQSKEFLNKNWTKSSKRSLSPNLCFLSDHFDLLYHYVLQSLLSEASSDLRSKLLKKFVDILSHLKTMNNFHSLFAIMEALNHRAIGRMKKTWELVGEHYYNALQGLNKLKEKGYRQYRDTLRINITPPCIPHLEVWKSDIINIEKNTSEDIEGMINFKKLKKIAAILLNVQSFQSTIYCFLPSPDVQSFFFDQWKSQNPMSNDEYYSLSLSIEPKALSASVDLPWLKEDK